MKDFKGTKGEWYIIASEQVEIATDKKSVCYTVIQDYHNKDIEQIANAKLIAAAPELLKALQELYECVAIEKEIALPITLHEQVEKAIKKALQ